MAEKGDPNDGVRERFPLPPASSDVPEAPKIEVRLPSREDSARRGAPAPGSHRKLAIASTAASSFVAPILVLALGGWWLDQRLHSGGIWAFAGAVLGFAAGIFSLMRVIQQLNR